MQCEKDRDRMAANDLDVFIGRCREVVAGANEPATIVRAVAPRMRELLLGPKSFLRSEHFQSDPRHYARNAIYTSDDDSLSLFALVWLPGQWTPVHDHGSWGVVGVVRGVIEERNYLPMDGEIRSDSGIRLRPGAMTLLPEGAVTTFVPNPDHIHVTGVPEDRAAAVSLHLYGRNMHSFHIYDLAEGNRRLVDVPHYRSR